MPNLLYLSLARFPTEKAHGLQIAQNCEAFANAGYNVRLWVARRFNSPAMRQISDPYTHYGVEQNFSVTWIPCLDLYPLARRNLRLEKVAFVVQVVTTIMVALLRLSFARADVYYSRDEYLLLALSLFLPREKLVFEIHQFWTSRKSSWIQRQVVQRVGRVIAITPRLHEDVIARYGAEPERVLVAHDGIRAKRFAVLPEKNEARHDVGWPEDAFIVGFVGRLQMLLADKGVDTLVLSLAQVEGASLALVGGPDDMAHALREQWLRLGLPESRFLYAGQVKPDAVPLYLSAFDVCAMPHPFTEQFAYYTSPLKLFEYMAASRPIVASDLPGWSDVVQHDETALLVAPGDVGALAEALRRLRDNPDLREQLGRNARERVMQHYTWATRAEAIRAHIERATIAISE